MKIGLVDLDTSHPQSWIPLERQLGHEITGVWDGGSVHPAEYVKDFAAEHNIPRVYETLEEMAADVDCAIIHGCDWDTHVAKAQPFVQAGKGVLIDKPIAGNLRDLNQFRQWVNEGAKITGGSSLRFAYEVQEWLAQDVAERGTAHTVLCGCAVDDFNYGIHAYSMLCGIMGEGIESVQHLGEHVQKRIQVNWADGRMGLLVVGQAAQWQPFYATISTEKSVTQFNAATGKVYQALLEKVLPYLAGEEDQPPVSFDVLIEAELTAIAARRSWLEGNREVKLNELSEEDDGYDGKEFAVGYRKARYPDA